MTTTTTTAPGLTGGRKAALTLALVLVAGFGVAVVAVHPVVDPTAFTDRVGGHWTCTATGTYAGHTELACQGGPDKFWSWTKRRGTGEVFAVDDGPGKVHFFDAADATTAATDVEAIPDLAVTAKG